MMQLIEYIREYNDDAEGVDLSFLDNFIIDGQWNQNYSYEEKKDLLMEAY